MNKYKTSLIPVLSLIVPFIAAAATTINNIINTVGNILNLVIPILMILATIVFIWGIIMFITAAGSDDKRKEGKQLMIWGIIGLFVMVAMWGLVSVIGSTFGIEQVNIPPGPGELSF